MNYGNVFDTYEVKYRQEIKHRSVKNGIIQNMDWTGQLDWTIGLDSWTGQLDWTAGLDSWTGLFDWDSFLLNRRNSMFLRKAK